MSTERDRQMARSFGAAAGAYDRARPGYPADAVAAVLPGRRTDVLDVGAGTGKLTRVLLEIALATDGFRVTAVEPLAGMRDVFAVALPQVPVLDGNAESIPLPGASVDAVLFGQAWHWVDPAQAVPEVARVLRPGGTLGLLWNDRDQSADSPAWARELGRILDIEPAGADTANPVVGSPFGAPVRRVVRWAHTLTRTGLIDLVNSRSYVITLEPAARADLLGRVNYLLDTHPDLQGRDEFDLPYLTTAWRYGLA